MLGEIFASIMALLSALLVGGHVLGVWLDDLIKFESYKQGKARTRRHEHRLFDKKRRH